VTDEDYFVCERCEGPELNQFRNIWVVKAYDREKPQTKQLCITCYNEIADAVNPVWNMLNYLK